ncbi:MAG: hypothetical protein ACRDQZ_05250, partial [Mycobacteriales bacterium]
PTRRISPHIYAYRRRRALIAPSGNLLQIGRFSHGSRQMAGVVAMQKVEGSNPFSRFEVNPLHMATSPLTGKLEPPPHIPSIRGTTSASNRGDARRLAAISPDSPSLSRRG